MDAQNSYLFDPFISHLVVVLSIYELGPFPAPVPRYSGPSNWQTDNILNALKTMARRMYTAEDTLASIKTSENWENGPDTKKRRSVGDTQPISDPSANSSQSDLSSPPSRLPTPSNGTVPSGYSSATVRSMSGTPNPHSSSSPSLFHPYHLAALSPDFEQDVNMSETSSDHDPSSDGSPDPDRTASPMTISLDGAYNAHNRTNGQARGGNGSISAPTTSHIDSIPCPICGRTVSDAITIGKITVFRPNTSGSSPLVLPPGPLTTAAFESGMSAVEELRLLKAQVQDVARVCNAVALGDLSQKITVPVQGVVMVQLKDVINGMVDKLGQFAREVTRVSQEVGTEGYVFPVLTTTHI
jgi:osomolarity two-component system sensor histidine kinase NIK1